MAADLLQQAIDLSDGWHPVVRGAVAAIVGTIVVLFPPMTWKELRK